MNYKNNNVRKNGINQKSIRFNVPKGELGLELMPHQLALLYEMMMVEKSSVNSQMPFGLLSDKTGSGKTYVVLAYIYLTIKLYNIHGLNIIVVQHNLYQQWIRAINLLLGNKLNFKCITENSEINSLYGNPYLLNQFNIVLITPILYESFVRSANGIKTNITRIFFDEADTMGHILFSCLKANMTWFISATISSIFNQTTLTAQIGTYNLYLPILLKNECYCDENFINSVIKLPKPQVELFICKDFYLDYILVFLLNKEQISNINSHNYMSIKNECGHSSLKSKKDVVKHLYSFCIRTIVDSDILLKDLNRSKSNKNERKFELTNKRNFYKNRYDMINNITHKYNLCIECFSNISSKCYKSTCGSLLCLNCYSQKYELTCINCSKVHNDWEEYIPNELPHKLLSHLENSDKDKFYYLNELLDICSNKIILYCNGNTSLGTFLQNYCSEKECLHEELNGGNFKESDRILDQFRNNNDVKILLIDNPDFVVGLNLEFATDIVFFHETDLKTKNQLVGRAQRLGRKKSLNVWFLYYKNEK